MVVLVGAAGRLWHHVADREHPVPALPALPLHQRRDQRNGDERRDRVPRPAPSRLLAPRPVPRQCCGSAHVGKGFKFVGKAAGELAKALPAALGGIGNPGRPLRHLWARPFNGNVPSEYLRRASYGGRPRPKWWMRSIGAYVGLP